jgi:hypothetical protein
MRNSVRPFDAIAFLAVAVGLLMPGTGSAQSAAPGSQQNVWQVSASVYVYLPSIGGKTSFPVEAGGGPINVSADKILDSLKMTFMGALDAHNGQWGLFTDLLYFDLGKTKTDSSDFTIGNIGLPAGTTANLDLDLKAWVWTLAGEYRVVSDPAFALDLLAGARMLDLTERLRWSITGSLGPIVPAGRSGTSEVSQTSWDAIVGVKGRYVFGDHRQWSVPLYLDVGGGQSKLTWQAATGVSYAFKWGEMSALWRYLDYDMKSGKAIQSVNLSGPLIGATFRW